MENDKVTEQKPKAEDPKPRASGEFIKAREALAAISWAEEYRERKYRQDVEWEDQEDRQEYFRGRRRGKRWAFLFKVAPELKCPSCNELKIRSREWVIFEEKEGRRKVKKAECRSCHWLKMFASEKGKECIKLPFSIFEVAEVRFKFDNVALRKAIAKMGISGSEFARRAGWSRGWQRKLEDGLPQTVNDKTMEAILNVLVDALIFPEDADEFCKELEKKDFFKKGDE